MILQLSAEELSELVPFAELRAELREMLLPYCGNHHLAANARLEIDLTTTSVYLPTGGLKVESEAGEEKYFAMSLDGRLPLPLPKHGRAIITTESSAHILTVDRRRVETALTCSNLHEDGERPDVWLVPILRCELLARLPSQNVHRLLRNAQDKSYEPGARIIAEGEVGNAYYLIVSGECSVTRATDSGLDLMLATLAAGDSFGEQTLLTGEARNAAIEAGPDGATVLAITAADFHSQIHTPLVPVANYAVLDEIAQTQRILVDVRSGDEYGHDALPDAIHIPLDNLRDLRDTLTPTAHYFVYCDTGKRAAAGAFLLAEIGLSATALTGDRSIPPVADPETEAAELEASIAAAKARYEASLKGAAQLQADADAVRTDANLRAQINAARETLFCARETHSALEQQMGNEHAERARQEAELREARERLKRDTEIRLRAEQARLQEHRQQADQRMQSLSESLIRLQRAADLARTKIEEEIAAARTRVDAQITEAKESLTREVVDFDARAEQLRDAELQQERELIANSEQALHGERQRLQRAVAESVTQMRAAERNLGAAEHKRLASKARAVRTVGEQRAQQQLAREEVEALLAAKQQSEEVVRPVNASGIAKQIVAEESLRLQMQTEIESLLRREVEDVNERAKEAELQLNVVAEQRNAAIDREAHEHEADENLFADIGAQLDTADDSRIAGESAYLHSRRGQFTNALNSQLEEKHATHSSINRARAHLARLRERAANQNF